MFRADRVKSGVEEGDCHFLQCEEISRSSLLQFKQTGRLCDVIIDVFGKRIKAHKVSREREILTKSDRECRVEIVLAANSEYFATLFCSPLNETSGEIVYFGEESEDDTR